MSSINGGTRGVGIGVADYVVFGISLVIPVIISLYYCCIKKQKSNAEFLMGNRSINAIPMGFSLCASYMSAIVITGICFSYDVASCQRYGLSQILNIKLIILFYL